VDGIANPSSQQSGGEGERDERKYSHKPQQPTAQAYLPGRCEAPARERVLPLVCAQAPTWRAATNTCLWNKCGAMQKRGSGCASHLGVYRPASALKESRCVDPAQVPKYMWPTGERPKVAKAQESPLCVASMATAFLNDTLQLNSPRKDEAMHTDAEKSGEDHDNSNSEGIECFLQMHGVSLVCPPPHPLLWTELALLYPGNAHADT